MNELAIYLFILQLKLNFLCYEVGPVVAVVNRFDFLVCDIPHHQQAILFRVQGVKLLMGKPANVQPQIC